MNIVDGLTATITEGMSFAYMGENSWMDHLEPLNNAVLILENQDPLYGTTIMYEGPSYKTIGSSHEFGGLSDGTSPSTKAELMQEYLEYFGILSFDLIAYFIADPTQVCIDDTIYYSDFSVGSINSWYWEFEGGDPATSTDQNPEIVYNESGLYDVKLIVSNGSTSDTLTKQNYVTVLSPPGIPATPTGADEVCTNFELSSDYLTAGATGAEDYIWNVSPLEAGVITPNGTTAIVSWTENWQGTAYISVKGVNDDCGESEYSDTYEVLCMLCTGIDDLSATTNISLYPNPAQGVIYILSKDDLINTEFSLKNMYGKVVMTDKINISGGEASALNLSKQSPGLYFIELKSGDIVFQQKIIIN